MPATLQFDALTLADILIRLLAAAAGASCILVFFKSIIRLGVLNERYQDALAFWVGRVTLYLFRLRLSFIRANRKTRNEIMTWYWPCALFGVISTWFIMVMVGFALLDIAFASESTLATAIVSSGSALSTLGFATPATYIGQILAIIEGAIGLFIIVYLFTFLPGFMDLIHDRGGRVEWIYARTQGQPSGVELVKWLHHNQRDLLPLWENWERFFRRLAQSRSFLPILCVVRPLNLEQSWVTAFGSFMDATALFNTTVLNPTDSGRLCFQGGVDTVHHFHSSMQVTPLTPKEDPTFRPVTRESYDHACSLLEDAGVPLQEDRDRCWKEFCAARAQYEKEMAWLAAALSDPLPEWAGTPEDAMPASSVPKS